MPSLFAVTLFAATSLSELADWVGANWGNIAVSLSVVIAGASLLIKGLEMLVSALLTVFPGLKTADGELKHIAAWLDALSKSKFLNAAAMSPKKDAGAPAPAGPQVAKAALLLLLAGALLAPTPARAGFDWAVGPTLPVVKVDLAPKVQTSVAPGAGVQVSLTNDLFKREFLGKSWDLLDLDLMAFGTLVNQDNQQFGQLSAAVGAATMSSLIFGGFGYNLAGPLAGKPFVLFAFSFNFAISPTAPPTGVENGPAGLVRGNTLFFGAP